MKTSLSMLNDRQLLELIEANGSISNAAFVALTEKYKRIVMISIQYIQPCPIAAQDIMQETLLKMLLFFQERKFQLKEYGFKPWFIIIAQNVAINELRRKKMTEKHLERFSQIQPSESKLLADSTVKRKEQIKFVECMINTLPQNQRNVMILRYFYEIPYKEIAEKEGLLMNTCKGMIHQAHQKLLKFKNLQ